MAVEGSCAIVNIALPQADETVVLGFGKRADEFLELPLEQPETRNATPTINAKHLGSITLSITPTDACRFLAVSMSQGPPTPVHGRTERPRRIAIAVSAPKFFEPRCCGLGEEDSVRNLVARTVPEVVFKLDVLGVVGERQQKVLAARS
jgi:hypothetical protein